MLIDRPQISEGSVIINATVPSGAAFPTNPDVGELFYLTAGAVGLHSYSGSGWIQAAKATDLATHIADDARHLTTSQNTLLDAVTVTATQLNTIPSLTTRITNDETALTTHIADDTKHLTAAQNTLLDGLASTLTATELNFVDGVTSSIQAQLNAIVTINNQQTSDIQNLVQTGDVTQVNADLQTHKADDTRHLTTAQNTFLDGLTVPFADVNKVLGLSTLLGATTFSTYLTALSTEKLARNGSIAATGNLNLGGFKVTNTVMPTASSDGANKAYVDNFLAGLKWADSVRVATIGQKTLSALGSLDGVTLVAGDRVLVKDQTNKSENGIWLAAAGVWIRATDYNTAAALNGSAVFVREGSTQLKTTWVQVSTVTTVGTDTVTYSPFSGPTLTAADRGITFPTAHSVAISLFPNGGLVLTADGTAESLDPGAQLALPNVVAPGNYGSVTVDAKGRVIAGTAGGGGSIPQEELDELLADMLDIRAATLAESAGNLAEVQALILNFQNQ